MKAKLVNKVGWIASAMTLLVFLSFIDQIRLNLSGQKGSAILPLMAVGNCVTWSLYAYLKPKKDWPLLVCNLPGIIITTITFITAVI